MNQLTATDIGQLYGKRYRVSLQCPAFKGKKKWSNRMQAAFENQGKKWDDRIEMDVKQRVSEAVAANPSKVLNAHKRSAFDALVTALETRLTLLGSAGALPQQP